MGGLIRYIITDPNSITGIQSNQIKETSHVLENAGNFGGGRGGS
jgi:hypothetical protein